MAQSAARDLIEDRLGCSLYAFTTRGEQWSLRELAAVILTRTGVIVSHETLRRWLTDAA